MTLLFLFFFWAARSSSFCKLLLLLVFDCSLFWIFFFLCRLWLKHAMSPSAMSKSSGNEKQNQNSSSLLHTIPINRPTSQPTNHAPKYTRRQSKWRQSQDRLFRPTRSTSLLFLILLPPPLAVHLYYFVLNGRQKKNPKIPRSVAF